jgi:GDP-L-fucose synthase
MNILVTGCNSFLGKEISQSFLRNEYELIMTDRTTLDVSNEDSVNTFFDNNKVDIVVHTAIKGGTRNHNDKFQDFFNNIGMFNNLLKHSDKFKLMFNFGSGAEFGRTGECSNKSEEQIYEYLPSDFYGLAKNLITREINSYNGNIINLRLFGCFGLYENENRFIKNALRSIQNNEPITIHQNKKMDFISASDVFRIIDYYIKNYNIGLPTDINLCYNIKRDLKSIAKQIYTLTNIEENIIINNVNMGKEYTGDYSNLYNLGCDIEGFDMGLENIMKDTIK